VEKFIDTPVKRYSSGMYVRLAFAVAAHLEPEILLVDEVLAVGDAAFQKKCLGKMGDVAKEGRTVLFVSHNMGVLREVSQRGVWLKEGKMLYDGDVKEAIAQYLSSGQTFNQVEVDLSNHPQRLPNMKPILKSVSCSLPNRVSCTDFSQNDDIVLEVDYSTLDGINLAGAGFIINTIDGIRVGGFNTYMAQSPPHRLPRSGKVIFTIPARQFTPGTYLVTLSLGSHPGVLEDKVEAAIGFTVHPSDIYGTGYLLTREDGVAALSVKTHIEAVSN
jgi:lipopolysaccharide transport system ATP-binding protein